MKVICIDDNFGSAEEMRFDRQISMPKFMERVTVEDAFKDEKGMEFYRLSEYSYQSAYSYHFKTFVYMFFFPAKNFAPCDENEDEITEVELEEDALMLEMV